MVEKYLSGFFLLLCAVYCYFAMDMSFGTFAKPKSGFMPIIVGVLAVVLSAVNFYQTMKKKTQTDGEGSVDAYTFRNLAVVLAGTAVFIFLLDAVGYLIASVLYLFFLMKVTRTKGWVKPGVISLGVALGLYFCFGTLLGVALP